MRSVAARRTTRESRKRRTSQASRGGAPDPRASPIPATRSESGAPRDNAPPASASERLVNLAVLGFCLVFSLWHVGIGWSNAITDMHGFRQTQTAITAWRFLEGGRWLAYETPILGPPWTLPFEFPLYQWLVALCAWAFGAPLDQAGRAVSLAFFYLSFVPAWVLLGCWVRPLERCIFLSLLLISPQYLFWSRTFMIESTALFLCLAYLAAVAVHAARPRMWLFVLAALFGVLGALVKITTFAGFALAAACILAGSSRRGRLRPGEIAVAAVASLLVPMLAESAWRAFTDAYRAQNALGAKTLSANLRPWIFGTLEQRASLKFLRVVFWSRVGDVIGSGIALPLVLVGAFYAGRQRLRALASVAIFAAVFLLFANVQQKHNYYAYGNAVFLLAAAGFVIVGLMERGGWARRLGLALVILLPAASAYSYYSGYYYEAQSLDAKPGVAAAVRTLTKPNEVVLIWGRDWSSEIPYYARRRAVMDYMNSSDREMESVLAGLRRDEVGAALFCGPTRLSAGRIEEIRARYGLGRSHAVEDCDIFARR